MILGIAYQACLAPLLQIGISIRWAIRAPFAPTLWEYGPPIPTFPFSRPFLKTQASIDPLRRYGSLAVVAHSMGGLVVQRALVDDPRLAERTNKVIFFRHTQRRSTQGILDGFLEAAAEEYGGRQRVHYNTQTGLGRAIRTRAGI